MCADSLHPVAEWSFVLPAPDVYLRERGFPVPLVTFYSIRQACQDVIKPMKELTMLL